MKDNVELARGEEMRKSTIYLNGINDDDKYSFKMLHKL